jgi:RND family efflux transporter MFP subunit
MAWLTRLVITLVCLAGLGGVGWGVWHRLDQMGDGPARTIEPHPAAVEVAAVRHGPIEWRRTYSGTLEAHAEFVVSPKVAGRVERLAVDMADTVSRGQVVAELDDDEYVQAVNQAKADQAVAAANLVQAQSALTIAKRELERIQTLRKQGVASDTQLDVVISDHLAKEAAVEVAKAQATRAEAALQTAKIRLGYTKVTATWTGQDTQRVVGERFVDEGETVAANGRLMSIVSLDPIDGVVYATEREYARLTQSQPVTLTTDAYPGRTFAGQITRISPVFRQASRQARIELRVQNPDRALKPGMFVRAEVVLARVQDAVIVPMDALVTRDGQTGVFVVADDGRKVAWRPVKAGVREAGRLQVEPEAGGGALRGRVVTLGQQLIDDGSAITIPEIQPPTLEARGSRTSAPPAPAPSPSTPVQETSAAPQTPTPTPAPAPPTPAVTPAPGPAPHAETGP